MSNDPSLAVLLARIAAALERLAPSAPPAPDPGAADAFVWEGGRLRAVAATAHVPLGLLRGVDRVAAILRENVERFAAGLPANHAMLWGARGMGKSSLVKAVHAAVNAARPGALALIEVHREDLASLPALLATLRGWERRCLLFCDDLSFETPDPAYKALKSVLDGGIEGVPANILFVATSNRRHLMPREAIENEGGALMPAETVEEKVSLSDRFGLWLGFHACDAATYLAMVEGYAAHFGLALGAAELRAQAETWSRTRGARSGRVAWQFVQSLRGAG